MNKSESLAYLADELSMLPPSGTTTMFTAALAVLNDAEATNYESEMAVQVLNTIWGDTTLNFMDANVFAQAVCCVSLNNSPNLPPRPTTHR